MRQRLHAPTDTPLFPLARRAHPADHLAEAGIPCAVASSSNRRRSSPASTSRRARLLPRSAGGNGAARQARPRRLPARRQPAAGRAGHLPAFEDSENGARAADRAGMRVVTVPDLKVPTEEVAGMSFRLLGRLDEAVEHVPVWFAGRGGVGMA